MYSKSKKSYYKHFSWKLMKTNIKMKIFACVFYSAALVASQLNACNPTYEVDFVNSSGICFYFHHPKQMQQLDLSKEFADALNNKALCKDKNITINQNKVAIIAYGKKSHSNEINYFLFKQDQEYFWINEQMSKLYLNTLNQNSSILNRIQTIETFFTPNDQKKYDQQEKNFFTAIIYNAFNKQGAVHTKLFRDPRFDTEYLFNVLFEHRGGGSFFSTFKKNPSEMCHYITIEGELLVRTKEIVSCQDANANYHFLLPLLSPKETYLSLPTSATIPLQSTTEIKKNAFQELFSLYQNSSKKAKTVIIIAASTMIVQCMVIIYLLTKNKFKQA